MQALLPVGAAPRGNQPFSPIGSSLVEVSSMLQILEESTPAGGAEIPAGVDETHAGVVAPSAPVGPDPVRILTRLQALRIVYGSKAPSV